jgi:hypothetical protein
MTAKIIRMVVLLAMNSANQKHRLQRTNTTPGAPGRSRIQCA